MAMLEEAADGLARRTMEQIRLTGDDAIEEKVSSEIGAYSPTLQEAFSTAMRIRKAERRGASFLDRIEAKTAAEREQAIVLPPPEDA